MAYTSRTRDAKAHVCGTCRRPLPIDCFRLKTNMRGYTFYEIWACKKCQRQMYDKPRSEEEKRNRYWKRQEIRQARLNGKRAPRRKKRSYMSFLGIGQTTFLSPSEALPCCRCDSLGPKYKGKGVCKECAKQDAKMRRAQRKLEDPEWYTGELARLKEYRESHHRRKKRKHRPGDYFPPKHWEVVLEVFNHQCAYCDGVGILEQDHVVPYSKGGAWRLGNIVPACPECNGWYGKRNHDMREWLNDEMRYEAILTTMGDVEWQLDFAS